MRKFINPFLFFTLSFLPIFSNAQVSGISGSKLNACCTDVVDHKKLEFEPEVYFNHSNSYWNNKQDLLATYQSPDSLTTNNGMYVRMTYGIWNRFELGVNIDSDLTEFGLGAKGIVFQNGKTDFALIGGLNSSLSLISINKNADLSGVDYSYGGGFVTSITSGEYFSVDLSAQYMLPFSKNVGSYLLAQYYNVDVGYYIHQKQFQPIVAIGYSTIQVNNTIRSELLSLSHGFSLEKENYIFVACLNNDIWGKNSIKNSGGFFALTLLF